MNPDLLIFWAEQGLRFSIYFQIEWESLQFAFGMEYN